MSDNQQRLIDPSNGEKVVTGQNYRVYSLNKGAEVRVEPIQDEATRKAQAQQRLDSLGGEVHG